MTRRGLKHRGLDAEAARHIDQLFLKARDPFGHKLGESNERYALNIVKQLITLGEIPAEKDAYLTEHNSDLDQHGFDIMIPTKYGDVGIQIKSSERKAADFRRRHPQIPCIVVPRSPIKAIISDKLKSAILQKYEWLKQGRS